MRSVSIAAARDRLTAIIHDVEGGAPVELTRHGRPVAVLLSIRDYEHVCGRKSAFIDALQAFRRRYAKELLARGEWNDESLRDAAAGRAGEPFE